MLAIHRLSAHTHVHAHAALSQTLTFDTHKKAKIIRNMYCSGMMLSAAAERPLMLAVHQDRIRVQGSLYGT